MAFIEQRGDWFRIIFRYAGKRYTHTLETRDRSVAEGLKGGIEKALMLLGQKVLQVPEGADLLSFVLSNGQVVQKPAEPKPNEKNGEAGEPITLQDLKDRYLQTHSAGALEENSLDTVVMHLRHFIRTLGVHFPVQTLTAARLQEHIDRRAKQKGLRKRPLSPTTLRKEMASFRAVWNWGVQMGLLTGPFPNRGLRYPKAAEKPPFQTWEEIERQIARGGLDEREQKELWDCLFLTLPEIAEFLAFVKENARHPFLYPMFCFAAHTGARRSEMLRARIHDVDLEAGTVILHEKKRSRGQRTHRRVPLSPFLLGVLKDWLAVHPGGQALFCQEPEVSRSKKRSRTTGHKGERTRATTYKGRVAEVKPRTERPPQGALTRDESHDHFKRMVAGSKWEVLRGWHVFRHSFVSNCAARGIDQRVIDEWTGHQTEEMRKRYRHLFPNQQRQAIRLVFGDGSNA